MEAINLNKQTTHQARPTKLRNGRWGVRVLGSIPEPGDLVHVTTRSGKEWTCEVSRVYWSGETDDGPVAICSTRRLPEDQPEEQPSRRRTSRRRRKRPAERRAQRKAPPSTEPPRDAESAVAAAFPGLEWKL